MSTKDRLINFFLGNVGVFIPNSKIQELAKIQDWPRMIRSLRQEGWEIEYNKKLNGYTLISGEKKINKKGRTQIPGNIRYFIIQRDDSKCQRCGKGIQDGIKLEVDHKLPVDWGGGNDTNNLWTLCNICNGGKKNLFSDFDNEIMKEVSKQNSGYNKILVFFKLNPNKIIEPFQIEVVSGIRDWTRTIRLIRQKEKINIQWIKPNKDYPSGGYQYII